MKNLKKISLEDEINREGKQIEDEIRADQELEDIKVSDDLESALFNKIQEYEFDKKVTTIVRKKKRRTYVLVGIAAVLIMMLGSVMTAVGSKSYGKLPWEKDDGDETFSYLDVEGMETKESEDIDEVSVYKEITKKLGISPVRIMEKPDGMYLKDYNIDENQNKAILFYTYNGENIRYSMYMNNSDSSLGQKTLDNLEQRFVTVRAGRANPSSLDGITADYYGSPTPLKQLATISVPEARQLLIKPFDRSCLGAIEKAIFESNLGYTPNNDGETIRIIIPVLTEERRKELTKQVRAMAEDAKVSIRNIRHDANEDIEKEEISEDEQKNLQNRVQDLVNKYNKLIDEKTKEKENELMTV